MMFPPDSRYLALKTFRKNGKSVITPVWFVMKDADSIFVITREKTGKVKRIRNNSQVDITLSNFSGKPRGEWISSIAKEVDGKQAQEALKLRGKKYGILSKIIGFFSRKKGEYVVFFYNQKMNVVKIKSTVIFSISEKFVY